MGTKLQYNYAFNNAEAVFHAMFTYLTCKQHDIKMEVFPSDCTLYYCSLMYVSDFKTNNSSVFHVQIVQFKRRDLLLYFQWVLLSVQH